jgi:predicted nucleotidyltransferase
MNKIIFRCKFGSDLYGTNTENSDVDYKSVFIPDGKDLILQKAAKHLQNNTKDNDITKNSKDDIDDESFSIKS